MNRLKGVGGGGVCRLQQEGWGQDLLIMITTTNYGIPSLKSPEGLQRLTV